MRKILCLIVLSLVAVSMMAQGRFSNAFEISAGTGLARGPLVVVTPQYVAQYNLAGGLYFGAGAGLRIAAPCFRYSIRNGEYDGSSYIEELDIPLFLRAGYKDSKLFASIDAGYAVCALAFTFGSAPGGLLESRYGGLFFEPHIGIALEHNRFLSLGMLWQKSRVQDAITTESPNHSSVSQTVTTRNIFTPAITLRYGVSF